MKYTLEHTGKPFAGRIPDNAWQKLSEHKSIPLAMKRIHKHREHLNPWEWNDHYRITLKGRVISQAEIEEAMYAVYERKYND